MANVADDDGIEIVEETAEERAAREEAARLAEPVRLRCVNEIGEEVNFKVKPNTKVGKIMKAYCLRFGVQLNEIRFLFDGNRLNGQQTVAKAGLVDEDTIDVYAEQRGGGPAGDVHSWWW